MVRGQRLSVTVEAGKVTYALHGDQALRLMHDAQEVLLGAHQRVAVLAMPL
jgi:hypothetical protein